MNPNTFFVNKNTLILLETNNPQLMNSEQITMLEKWNSLNEIEKDQVRKIIAGEDRAALITTLLQDAKIASKSEIDELLRNNEMDYQVITNGYTVFRIPNTNNIYVYNGFYNPNTNQVESRQEVFVESEIKKTSMIREPELKSSEIIEMSEMKSMLFRMDQKYIAEEDKTPQYYHERAIYSSLTPEQKALLKKIEFKNRDKDGTSKIIITISE